MKAVITKGQTSVPCSQRNSKKYSKVNEELKKEFLFLIILHNKSIKEASQTLNINYSSAKAILASHRKHVHATQTQKKGVIEASYKTLNTIEQAVGSFKVISSIGGCEISTFDQYENQKLFYKSSIAPVILLRSQKQVESSQQTEHKSDP